MAPVVGNGQGVRFVFVLRKSVALAVDFAAMADEEELPDGWTSEVRTMPCFEWRCPNGDECNKGYRLLYKKSTREEAIEAGAWHLNDPNKHNMQWVEAKELAEQGITESDRDITVYIDGEGTEHSCLPKHLKGKSKGKGSEGKGKGKLQERPRTPNRSRSRHRRRDRHAIQVRHHSRGSGSGSGGGGGEIRISRVELDELIDGVNRASLAASHCAGFCEKAAITFRQEAEAMQACKFMLERFRRA